MIILGPVAVAKNGVIGKNNALPWNLPEDLKHFKQITSGKNVLMGSKTFESIFTMLGKPLPNRHNIVLTFDKNYKVPEGVELFFDVPSSLEKYKNQDLYVIGGGQIYKQFLPLAQKLYMTHIFKDYEGDAFFPEINWQNWKKVSSDVREEFEFAVYERK